MDTARIIEVVAIICLKKEGEKAGKVMVQDGWIINRPTSCINWPLSSGQGYAEEFKLIDVKPQSIAYL